MLSLTSDRSEYAIFMISTYTLTYSFRSQNRDSIDSRLYCRAILAYYSLHPQNRDLRL